MGEAPEWEGPLCDRRPCAIGDPVTVAPVERAGRGDQGFNAHRTTHRDRFQVPGAIRPPSRASHGHAGRFMVVQGQAVGWGHF